MEEKWTYLDCSPLQPVSALPWGRLIAFSKCLVFSADKGRLVGSLQELFPHCCYRFLGKMGSCVLVSAINSIAKQGPVALLLSFYLKMVQTLFCLCSTSHGEVDLWGPLFSTPHPHPTPLGGKPGYKNTALKLEYSDWSWISGSTSKIGCSYLFS